MEMIVVRLMVSRSKNAASLYVVRSIYKPSSQSNTTEIVEKLGTEAELRKKLEGRDPYEWAREYIDGLNKLEKERRREVAVRCSQSELIEKNAPRLRNGGYLFLQGIYHKLGLDKICKEISGRHNFRYNLNDILSKLVYSRILTPASKLETYEDIVGKESSKQYIEQSGFALHDVYRSLEVLSKESDFIQAELYKNSKKCSKRNDRMLIYDCTNVFFELEEEDELRRYGVSKEHRPNPIVQIGLFTDGDGIPLHFSIHPGNTGEQVTLKPEEKKIIKDCGMTRIVVCTDAGLSSAANRRFNSCGNRAFVTAQSIKKMKDADKLWALSPSGWRIKGSSKEYNLNDVLKDEEKQARYRDTIFFKEQWKKEDDGLEQRYVVTFSLKYMYYLRSLREKHIEKAVKLLAAANAAGKSKTQAKSVNSAINRHRQTDYRRFIARELLDGNGETAEGVQPYFSLNLEAIRDEERYDGFYAICSNLEDCSAYDIWEINHRRWQIEQCIRLMKSSFKARPVYLSRHDRIQAHFLICFIAIILFRFLEKKIGSGFTAEQILKTLRTFNFLKERGEGYRPAYTRTDLTDRLHEVLGFRTDYDIVPAKDMKEICRQTKRHTKL